MEDSRPKFWIGDRVHHKDDPDGSDPNAQKMISNVVGVIANKGVVLYQITGVEVDVKFKQLIHGVRTVSGEELTLIEDENGKHKAG